MTNIVEYVGENPVSVIVDGKKFDEFFQRIASEVKSEPVDLETVKGRKAIASTAYRIAQTKTAIDAAGKEMTDEARKKIKAIDAIRKDVRDRLDRLKAEVRAPLDEWEAREEERKAIVNNKIKWIVDAGYADFGDTSETMGARLAELQAFEIDPALFGEFKEHAEAKLTISIDALEKAIVRAKADEAEKAELKRLRAEAEKRETEERARREREELKRAEEERARRAEEERARIEAEASEKARIAAEMAAEERIRAAEAEKQRLIDAQHAEEQRREQEAKRLAEEERRRSADIENRKRVIASAAEAICKSVPGISAAKAKAVIEAIADGVVPNVTVRF